LNLSLRPLLKAAMDFRVHVPAWQVGGPPPWRLRDPAERAELVADVFNLMAPQTAHRTIAALDDAVRQASDLVRQNVAGDRGKPLVILRQAVDVRIERDGVGK